jgi:hypothetical protein
MAYAILLTDVDGRWYGRGTATARAASSCLVALRALGADLSVNLKLVVEGRSRAPAA